MSELVWWIAYAVAGTVGFLGLRLVRLSRRTRKAPELLMGLFFVSAGPCGVILAVYPLGHPDLAPDSVAWLRGVGGMGINVAMAALGAFTWRVFRPQEGWAGGFVAATVAIMLAAFVAHGLTAGFGERSSAWMALSYGVRLPLFAWAAVEPFLYWRGARRRMRLGLADPVVTNRFLLWSLWGWSCLAFLVGALASIAAEARLGEIPWLQLLTIAYYIACGSLVGGSIWLAFFPPRAYREALITRARVRSA